MLRLAQEDPNPQSLDDRTVMVYLMLSKLKAYWEPMVDQALAPLTKVSSNELPACVVPLSLCPVPLEGMPMVDVRISRSWAYRDHQIPLYKMTS